MLKEARNKLFVSSKQTQMMSIMKYGESLSWKLWKEHLKPESKIEKVINHIEGLFEMLGTAVEFISCCSLFNCID